MARDPQEIADELEDVAPSWLTRGLGSHLIDATAAVFAKAESVWEGWRDQLFRQTAEDPYLNDLGEDRGVERFPWEDADDHRERAYVQPESPTPARIKEALEERIPYEGWPVEIREMDRTVILPDGAADPEAGVFTDCAAGIIGDGAYARTFIVEFPIVEVEQPHPVAYAWPDSPDPGHVGQLTYTDHNAYVGATTQGLRRRYILMAREYLETHHPHATAWGFVVRDKITPALIDELFPQMGPIAGG